MSHVTHRYESCHTHMQLARDLDTEFAINRNQSDLTSHVTHTNKSYYTQEWVMSLIWVTHVCHMCVTWVHICYICVTSATHKCEFLIYDICELLIYVTWAAYVTWLIWVTHICDTHIRVNHVTHMQLAMQFAVNSHPADLNHASCHTDAWIMSHIWMSHVTYMQLAMGFAVHGNPAGLKSHVTHMNTSCHTYEWAVSRIEMRHVTHMNTSCHIYAAGHMIRSKQLSSWSHESCHTSQWVMSYIWMSHVTHMNESCHTYEWVMSYV